jgi:SAM-dependent methyltransferase
VAGEHVSERWARWRASIDLDAYEARFVASGDASPHGEADLVERLGGGTVLDAGCGTGRVAIELARRGHDVVGVDLDGDLLARARAKAPELAWVEADLAAVSLGRSFDVVVLAGNVLLFCRPEDRAAIVSALAIHVAPAGCLVAGYSIEPGVELDAYDSWCRDAGLGLDTRWATWAGDPYLGGPYAVSLHRPVSGRR